MKCLFLSIALLFLSGCTKKTAINQVIEWHPIVEKAKQTSLYSNRVDWPTVNTKFVELIGDETEEDLYHGLQYLLNSLGDKHGVIRSTKDYSIVLSYNGERSSTRPTKAWFVNNVINDVESKFSFQLLDGNLGYLRVVGIGPGDVKAQADEIRTGIVDLHDEGVTKWILDLRFNGGGNMEPMLSGLAPLLGNGVVGGAVDKENEVSRTYEIKDGQFYNYNRLACEMDNHPKINQREKVAILLSRYTVSSGEVVAVAFKGRENTIFIGEDSGGYTTGNGYDAITDDLALVISQDIFTDRHGVKYDNNVPVDVAIEFNEDGDYMTDAIIQKAKDWLLD